MVDRINLRLSNVRKAPGPIALSLSWINPWMPQVSGTKRIRGRMIHRNVIAKGGTSKAIVFHRRDLQYHQHLMHVSCERSGEPR